jgi:hypothetical protein
MKLKVDINVGGKPKHIVEIVKNVNMRENILSIRKRGKEKTYVLIEIEVDGCEPETNYAFICDDDDFIYACSEKKLAGAIVELNWLHEDEYRVINKKNTTLTIKENTDGE